MTFNQKRAEVDIFFTATAYFSPFLNCGGIAARMASSTNCHISLLDAAAATFAAFQTAGSSFAPKNFLVIGPDRSTTNLTCATICIALFWCSQWLRWQRLSS